MQPPRESINTLDVAVTAGLVIIGLLIATTTAFENSTKLALAILLATFEMMFLFFRAVIRRLHVLSKDSLTVIPRSPLCRVLYEHLNEQREQLLWRVAQLSDRLTCELAKHEMYAELIGLTNIVTRHRAGHQDGCISAISSVNIEDFDDEPLAEAYLDANRKAIARDVRIQRLFVLDAAQRESGHVIAIIRKHHAALVGPSGGGVEGSDVKWLLKSRLPSTDHDQDFALFANDVLVTQGAGGQRFELTQDGNRVKQALDSFSVLWHSPHAQPVSELTKRHGRR